MPTASSISNNVLCDGFATRERIEREFCVGCSASSYLASGDKLQRAQSALHVGDVGLEIIESIGDARLDLGRVLPRRAVGGDLVEGGRRHVGGCVEGCRSEDVVSEMSVQFWRRFVDHSAPYLMRTRTC